MNRLPNQFEGLNLYPHQKQTCEALMAGTDTLLVSPTGSGKSLCYLLPTRIRSLRTLVVSPLIALMDDQVRACRRLNFNAECIHSHTDRDQQWHTLAKWVTGSLQIVFTSPERLLDQSLVRSLKQIPPGLIVIDEAHCVVTWGKRFRPAYLKLANVIADLGRPPVLAMTATAPPEMRQEIINSLGLTRPKCVCVPYSLANMSIEAKQVKASKRATELADLAAEEACIPMIVYCQTRRQSEDLTDQLCNYRVSARLYHAGLTAAERQMNLREFSSDQKGIMVATSAFEMGIDMPAVRSIVHFGLPSSLLAYVQGIGRAGRSTTRERGILLYYESDLHQLDAMVSFGPPQDNGRAITEDQTAMRAMFQFANSSYCRLLALNRYFFPDIEQTWRPCGRCDNCHPLNAINDIAKAAFMQPKSTK